MTGRPSAARSRSTGDTQVASGWDPPGSQPGATRVRPGGRPGSSWPPALLGWFASSARPLPWRSVSRDPYRVWVSEVMLQQTRVETVLRYYEPFLARFPSVDALAAAHEDDVMKAWEGLGYYRRARLLQNGARHVAARGMPACYREWLDVPGVGPYTAGAIASLAYGEKVPAVDGNVLRVWSRLAEDETDISTPQAKRRAEAWVLEHQPQASAGAFNEALMELGATVCTPSAPRCAVCPIASACAGRSRADELPVKAAKAEAREVRVSLAIVERGGKLLLEKRETGLLAGTWGLPWVEGGPDELRAHVATLVGAPVQLRAQVRARAKHAFTHRRWDMRAYEASTRGGAGTWRAPDEVALGTAHRKILRRLVEA